jgi:hypothetical protein
MPALKGILRNLRLTGCAFWTLGLAPRFPLLYGLTLALPPLGKQHGKELARN